MTSDPDGNIYLVSDSTMTVLKISPDAELLDKVSVSEIGASSASHIKLGTDGNLCDTGLLSSDYPIAIYGGD